jgi:MFS family permease
MRYRLTLSGSMGLVVAVGLTIAALREPSLVTLTVVYGLTIAALTFAVLLARYGRREAASFGFGAGLFGWVAFVMAFGPWRIAYQPQDLDKRLSDFLPTHLLVVAISYHLYPPPDPTTMTTSLDARVREYQRHSAMMGIGDCLVALWLGLIGGVIATAMAGWRRRARGRSPSSGGGPGSG